MTKLPTVNWHYVLSMPFIYGVFFPALLWHLVIETYHQICFRLYGIPLVDASEFFVNDRELLSMLNPWQKLNCYYCSYVNNLLRYSIEIAGRTERYWCPLKYSRRLQNTHSQYSKFIGQAATTQDLKKAWKDIRSFSDLKRS